MKSSISQTFFALAIAFLFSACSLNGDPEIEVTVDHHPYSNNLWKATIINIQSLADETVIKEVVINRGNCANLNHSKLGNGKPLKYGEVYTAMTFCKINEIREVTVTTNKSSSTFTFD